MTNCKRLGWSLAIAIVVFIALPTNANAAGTAGTSLTTSPVSLNLNIKPGTSTTKTLQLLDNGTQPLKINMVLDEFKSNGTTGQPLITEPVRSDPTLNWVSFSPSSFTVQPNVWASVKMTINLPKTAQLGYYFAAIFSPDTAAGSGIRSNTIKGSNGVLILIDTRSSNEVRTASVASFSLSKKVYEYLPANFTVSIHDSGNIYIAPFGNIYISRSVNSTHTTAALDVNSTGGNILPGSSRDFQASWNDGFPFFQEKTINGQVVRDKKDQPVEQLKWNFNHISKFRFGKYYAQLTMVYNNGQATIPLTSVVSFWVIPWKIVLGIILVGILIGLGLWSLIRYLIKLIQKIRRK